MDLQPSPARITPATPLSFRQPTYTTAGTLYNPNTSQPLQAPTRRGRSFKWTNGHGQSPLSLLPKSDLASLPLRGLGDRPQGYHQYSPLQQNYDRAVNPLNSPGIERHSTNLMAEMLQFRSMRPSDEALYPYSGEEVATSDNNAVGSEDESDSDLSTDPLMGMPVKSLHNLASYPNPNQKRAQKALLRGTKPGFRGPGGVNRSCTPEPSDRERRVEQPWNVVSFHSGHTMLQDDSNTPQHHHISFQANDRYGLGSSRHHQQSGFVPRSRAAPLGSPMAPASPTSFTYPGAPKPLTAGPPGMRQYRPSTFESTFKALGTNNGLQTTPADSVQGNPTQDGQMRIGLDNQFDTTRPDLGPVGQRKRHDSRAIIQPQRASYSLAPGGRVSENSRASASQTRDDSSIGEDSGGHLESKIPSMTNGIKWYSTWRSHDPEIRRQFQAGTDRLTEEEVQKRSRKTDDIWYANTGLFNRANSHSGSETNDATSRIGTLPKTYMSVHDANSLSTAEHAKPLLEAAFATLQRHSGK